MVSTHSRLKAAVLKRLRFQHGRVSTHSRLKAAVLNRLRIQHGRVSTHSRLKAAGEAEEAAGFYERFQHTAA